MQRFVLSGIVLPGALSRTASIAVFYGGEDKQGGFAMVTAGGMAQVNINSRDSQWCVSKAVCSSTGWVSIKQDFAQTK